MFGRSASTSGGQAMSDLSIFIIGLLVSFLCLGGTLIHGVVQGKVSKVDKVHEEHKKG